MADKHPVIPDRIRAHALQRRRVDVQRHRRIGAGMTHTVDVSGAKMKRVARSKRALAGRTVDPQALLAHTPAHHRHRPG